MFSALFINHLRVLKWLFICAHPSLSKAFGFYWAHVFIFTKHLKCFGKTAHSAFSIVIPNTFFAPGKLPFSSSLKIKLFTLKEAIMRPNHVSFLFNCCYWAPRSGGQARVVIKPNAGTIKTAAPQLEWALQLACVRPQDLIEKKGNYGEIEIWPVTLRLLTFISFAWLGHYGHPGRPDSVTRDPSWFLMRAPYTFFMSCFLVTFFSLIYSAIFPYCCWKWQKRNTWIRLESIKVSMYGTYRIFWTCHTCSGYFMLFFHYFMKNDKRKIWIV